MLFTVHVHVRCYLQCTYMFEAIYSARTCLILHKMWTPYPVALRNKSSNFRWIFPFKIAHIAGKVAVKCMRMAFRQRLCEKGKTILNIDYYAIKIGKMNKCWLEPMSICLSHSQGALFICVMFHIYQIQVIDWKVSKSWAEVGIYSTSSALLY